MKISESCLGVRESLPLYLGGDDVKEDQGNDLETRGARSIDSEPVRDPCAAVVADEDELPWAFWGG